MRTASLLALGSKTLANDALVLQVDVPALLLAGLVLEGESIDAVTGLDGVLALSIIALQRLVDGIKGSRGREVGYVESVSLECVLVGMEHEPDTGLGLPFLRDMLAKVDAVLWRTG